MASARCRSRRNWPTPRGPRIAALEALDTLLGVWGVSDRLGRRGRARGLREHAPVWRAHLGAGRSAAMPATATARSGKKKLAAGDYSFLLEGFDQKRAYARKAAALVDQAIEERMAALAAAVKVAGRGSSSSIRCPGRATAPSRCRGAATATAREGRGQRRNRRRRGGAGRLRFVARNLPPLGYRTFVAVGDRSSQRTSPPTRRRNCIENEFLRVTLDPARCGIRSIVCKRTGRELVNTQSPYALGQYLYERFDADQAAKFTSAYVLSPTSGEMISHGKPKLPLGQGTSLLRRDGGRCDRRDSQQRGLASRPCSRPAPRGIIPDATQLRVTLYAGQPWLDLEWSITNKTPDPWPEAGWLCFPLRADEPELSPGSPGQHRGPGQRPGPRLEP